MRKKLFKGFASINKVLLPSYSKKKLDMSKANKIQLLIINWKYFVTKNCLWFLKKDYICTLKWPRSI